MKKKWWFVLGGIVLILLIVVVGFLTFQSGEASSMTDEQIQEEIDQLFQEEEVVDTEYPICADTTCDMEGLCQRIKHSPELKNISDRSQCQ